MEIMQVRNPINQLDIMTERERDEEVEICIILYSIYCVYIQTQMSKTVAF